jgi:hypothetical protein
MRDTPSPYRAKTPDSEKTTAETQRRRNQPIHWKMAGAEGAGRSFMSGGRWLYTAAAVVDHLF